MTATCNLRRSALVVLSTALLAPAATLGNFVDPFSTVCSKQAEKWHALEYEAGNAIKACSNEFAPDEPSLCGYIGIEGNCTKEPDCEDDGVSKVKCPTGSSRTGGCCLIPKFYDCSGPNNTCLTFNGGYECQNTCEEIPVPAPAPAPAPVPTPAPAPTPFLAPAPGLAPVPGLAPAPVLLTVAAPLPVDEPALGPALLPPLPSEPVAVPAAVPAAEPAAAVPAAEAPVDDGFSIGTRDFDISPPAVAPETADDSAHAARLAEASASAVAVACALTGLVMLW